MRKAKQAGLLAASGSPGKLIGAAADFNIEIRQISTTDSFMSGLGKPAMADEAAIDTKLIQIGET